MGFDGRWAPYVPVAQRRARAAREANSLAKNGKKLRAIRIPGKSIATSFWGVAWCGNLEKYADWANRMPRGRTYARNGSIVDLQISAGKINSLVSGSSLYRIEISIEKIKPNIWKAIRGDCAANIGSLIDLMRGKLPTMVLKRLTDSKDGIFPASKEIKIRCSCPDVATMCKHAAATLYGVGHLLDTEPELFFLMRGVNQSELVTDALHAQNQGDAIGLDAQSTLDSDDLGSIFGIDLVRSNDSKSLAADGAKPKSAKRAASEKAVSKNAVSKNAVSKKTVSKKVVLPQAVSTEAASKKTVTKKAVVSAAETRSQLRSRILSQARKTVSTKATKTVTENETAKPVSAGKKINTSQNARTSSAKLTSKVVVSSPATNAPTKKKSAITSTKRKAVKAKK